MYDRILVPLDGSGLGERILPFVRLLGKRLHSRVELLRVAEPLVSYMTAVAIDDLVNYVPIDQEKEAQDYLEKVAELLREDGLEVTATVFQEIGPAACILDEAEKAPATLIAMSTHGRAGISRWLLGSVTDKVVRSAVVPTLVVRPEDESSEATEADLKNIIVPLDGSALAEQALPHAVSLARESGLELTIVRVVPAVESYSRYFEYSVGAFQHLSPDPDAQAEEYLQEIADRLKDQGMAGVEKKLLYGNPAEEIIELAKGTPPSLVAMTSHGRAGIGRWTLGSVADRVVRHSEFPVLLVPAAQEYPSEK